LESYQFRIFKAPGVPEIPHNSTLFHTVSHFIGINVGGQANSRLANPKFSNETKDLAPVFKAMST
jgi:hypothetical protein